MKPMQTLINKILALLAKRVLARYHPKVVAVAGSVGKTTTRRAVAAVLRRSFRTRESHKNFNNELGVPLSIFGETASGGSNPLAWLGIFGRAAWLAYGPTREYPAVLVLEMATDHHGDLAYLTNLARPDVAVVTAISEEHTEFLGDLDGVAQEEGTVVEVLSLEGVAILNADDPRVMAMKSRTQARVISFGFAESADVRASGAHLESALGSYFLRFDLATADATYPVNVSGVIGNGNVLAAAAAAAVGLALGLEPSIIPYGLAEFQPPPGRLRVIPGIKGTTLIDDTYNSSPQAAELALETLADFPLAGDGRRYAALGDMLELGTLTEESHRRVGECAAKVGIDVLIGVGPLSVKTCRAAVESGMSQDRVFHLANAAEAGRFLQERLSTGDLVLIKGSQGVRMEKVTKELMAEPERASELLVRQTPDWLAR
jgi:UDP-N-acetylmuramoyl-tripeptide--D-alanyl-D-alanine ligase